MTSPIPDNPAETATTAEAPETGGDPRQGRALRALRRATGMDAATFAAHLDVAIDCYNAFEAGSDRLPTAKLPRLAEALDAPLSVVLAELHGSDRDTADLATLANAFDSIPRRDQRDALLTMALTLADTDP